MEPSNASFSFKRLLRVLPRGEPLGTTYLSAHGLTAGHASHLARDGWLVHLGRGVYMLPGDTLTRDGSLAFLSRTVPGLHVGGKTALAWRGVRHTIAFRDHLVLWGEKQVRLPAWFLSRFDCTYQSTRLFDATLPQEFGLQPLPSGHPSVMVSVPERALLELLSDVGKIDSLDDTRTLVEGLQTLRTSVLNTLLQHTTRVKVIRLARLLSEDLGLPWAATAKAHSDRNGGKRWIAVTRSGERLDLRR